MAPRHVPHCSSDRRNLPRSSDRRPFKWWDTPPSGEELRESRRGPLKLRVHYSQSDEHQIGLTQSLEVPGSDSQPGELTTDDNLGVRSEHGTPPGKNVEGCSQLPICPTQTKELSDNSEGEVEDGPDVATAISQGAPETSSTDRRSTENVNTVVENSPHQEITSGTLHREQTHTTKPNLPSARVKLISSVKVPPRQSAGRACSLRPHHQKVLRYSHPQFLRLVYKHHVGNQRQTLMSGCVYIWSKQYFIYGYPANCMHLGEP